MLGERVLFQMKEKGTLYFFTGLAGAGKSTVGGLFYERLKAQSPDAILHDGHQAREAAVAGGAPRDYSLNARLQGAKGMQQTIKSQVDIGHDVVWCGMALFDEIRQWNRENLENYREVYLKVPMETLKSRRVELYSGREPQVVGLDLAWDEPTAPDIVIENDGRHTPDEIVTMLFEKFGLN